MKLPPLLVDWPTQWKLRRAQSSETVEDWRSRAELSTRP